MTEEQIFLAALDFPDRTGRIAYLHQACGPNSELRRRVEELLAAHERRGHVLDQPAAERLAAKSPAPQVPTDTLDADCKPVKADGSKSDPTAKGSAADDLQFLSPSTRPDALGRLGHYEILQVLGRGGFGIVFRAFDDTLHRVVAVKVMAPQIATVPTARKRFLREARSSAAVRHENVVQVYEVSEQPLPYLAMEFIPGETLQQKLDRGGPLEVAEVLRIGRQIAEGLAAAHASDLVHRDIKPSNILLESGSQKVKITDFGLARAADDASISQSGMIAGTPMFMAPEQALGRPIDQRADLFSLGSVLYQMATGRPPFPARSALAVLKRVAEEPARPIPEIRPDTPDWLCALIGKLHAKKATDRFQSAREVADLLADCEANFKEKREMTSVLAAAKPARPKWAVAAAVLLLSVIVLAVTEFAGATRLFRGQPGPTPGPVANPEPPPTKRSDGVIEPTAILDPDRKAALYVLSIGGTVHVNYELRPIKTADELPGEPFRLTVIVLDKNPQVNDASLAVFQNCKYLKRLHLAETAVTDTGLAHFKDCRDFIQLHLYGTKVTDDGLAYFKDCKELLLLGLSGTLISDAGLAHFKDCTKLQALLLNLTSVTEEGLLRLKDCQELTDIYLHGSQVTDAAVDVLKNFKRLKCVKLQATKISAAGIQKLKQALPELKFE